MRRALMRLAGVILCSSAALTTAVAQPAHFDFYDRGPYRATVPRPAQVLGYEPGTFHTSYGNMERYVDALLAAAPDRVTREPFGRTYEFRERALLIVTSPANHARMQAIREATAKLADPRLGAGGVEALIKSTPVTVWLNYSIHGDESASFEAMAQVAYQLAAGEDAQTRKILDSCVVILNLAHNPDGHERFVTWVNALGSGNPDPWALEQQAQQPWGIGGRTNHYQFDMNRDALAMSQLESRQIARAIRSWHPQVFVDHHGQTASYFFPPTAPPLHHVYPERDLVRWTERFGRENARAFDRYGWNYYVRDVFDFFYPGYWDSWPTLLGAIGMTYETDGGGNLALRRDDETVVTLLDGIERHFTASLATCATATAYRAERLRDFHEFARTAIAEAGQGGVAAYAIDPGDDPLRAAALAEDLLHAGVEVSWKAGEFKANGARAVWADAPAPAKTKAQKGKSAPPPPAPAKAAAAPHDFQHGAFIVDLAQPAARVARAFLERDPPIDSAFARGQLEKYQRNLKRGKNAPMEGYDFYDITAWSLPVTYGVEAFELPAAPGGAVALEAPDPNADDPAAERLADSLAIGVPQTARVARAGPLVMHDRKGGVALDLSGRIEGGRARTAYVWSCAQDGAQRLALRLLQEDFKVATATHILRAGGRDFPRGSFIARVERNPVALHERIAALAKSSGAGVLAVNSAFTESGDTGVGSENVVSLKRPRIAVLVDGPVSPTSYGWLWFLLERRLGLRFTAVRTQSIGSADLGRYNVIVIPDGGGSSLASTIGEGGIGALKGWVARGGTLVCLDDSAEFPTLKSVGLSTAWPVGVSRKEKKDDKDEEGEKDSGAVPDSVRELERRPQYVPGTIFWASLDPRHFLCYGFEQPRIPVMIAGRLFLKPSKDGANPLTFERAPLRLAGWAWPETERRLQGTAFAVDEPTGDGHVIMLEGPVTFRMFWRNTERLLLNAITYGPALD